MDDTEPTLVPGHRLGWINIMRNAAGHRDMPLPTLLEPGRDIDTNAVSVSGLAIVRLRDFGPLLEFAIST